MLARRRSASSGPTSAPARCNAVLTGLVVAFAVGALVVTLHGRATLDAPYDRLFDATNGAHVTVVALRRRRRSADRGASAASSPPRARARSSACRSTAAPTASA